MPLRIYLVEDDATYRDILGAELTVLSNQIKIVGHAPTEALAKQWLTSNPEGWDLILVDIFLREGTGAGVVRHCRNRSLTQCVIVMTAEPIAHIISHCMYLGADDAYNKVTEHRLLIDYCTRLACPEKGT